MYKTATGVVTDAQAAEIDALNEEIWKNFWEIPREKRTLADWESLFNIQVLIHPQNFVYFCICTKPSRLIEFSKDDSVWITT